MSVIAPIVCRILGVVALFAVTGCYVQNASSIPAPGARYASRAVRYAAYAWNAQDVISRWKAGTLWRLAQSLHVRTFMLGFTSADITRYSRVNGVAQMNAMIAEGKRHGVTFQLLLGDPGWIPPAGVPRLLRILHRLRNVHFAALNLDLEPNEVKGMPIKTVVMDLVDAMKQYVAMSSWPVTLDANWIYMNNGNGFNGGYCYPCGLKAARVKHISLLVYISDPKTVNAVAAPIVERYPAFTFRIGQSVEPPSELPKRDSYWHAGFAAFYADMQKLDATMRGRANYAGLDVESLQYLETMPR